MDYEILAKEEAVERVMSALAERGVTAELVNNKVEALERLKALIPQGVSIMNGSSRTLEEIGFVDYVKSGKHSWNNLHQAILDEKDPQKQSELRKQSVLSDYYLGSVHGVAETGEMVIASNSGSQLPHIVFTSPNLLFVVGTQKIVPNLEAAIRRVREYVLPREDKHMKSMGASGSAISKLLIFEKEPDFMKRTVRVIFVQEKLGF